MAQRYLTSSRSKCQPLTSGDPPINHSGDVVCERQCPEAPRKRTCNIKLISLHVYSDAISSTTLAKYLFATTRGNPLEKQTRDVAGDYPWVVPGVLNLPGTHPGSHHGQDILLGLTWNTLGDRIPGYSKHPATTPENPGQPQDNPGTPGGAPRVQGS